MNSAVMYSLVAFVLLVVSTTSDATTINIPWQAGIVNGNDCENPGANSLVFKENPSGAWNCEIRVPVLLPEGTSISSIKVQYRDYSPGCYVEASLYSTITDMQSASFPVREESKATSEALLNLQTIRTLTLPQVTLAEARAYFVKVRLAHTGPIVPIWYCSASSIQINY